jgi:Tol biopolymer transport system component/tRNA A-37 threonylcarbamoyl transferase component Bud32
MSLTLGTRLGPYEILSPLGAGGMGEVYRARDTRLGRDVAVKVLPQHLSSSPEVRARFEREAKTISSLNHPHICTLHDIGREGDTDYLVMELVEGETLADRLAKGALPTEQVLKLGVEIAGALDKAHRAGIVHRDLKPGNVMLTKGGAKLLDFGLARAAGMTGPGGASGVTMAVLSRSPTMSRPLTAEGTIVGTFQYMAPEQLEGKEADARTDIFALGATLYEMSTGKKAFSGTSQASLISAIMSSEPPPISSFQPMSPPALDRLVRTCLAKDPDERWQSAHDIVVELKWIAEAGLQAGVAPAVATRRRSRERIVWSIAVLLLASTVFLLARGVQRQATEMQRPIHAYLDAPEGMTFHFTGDEGAPAAVSPDGRRVVFGVFGGGDRLWVQSLETGAAEPLTSTDGARFPFWSPDGQFIGFFSEGKLKKIEADGGPALTLCDAPDPRGGTWGPNGVIVFAPNIRAGLYRIPASGGKPEPFTQVDSSRHTTHRWPCFLPDGRHVVYLAANHESPRSEQTEIQVMSSDGKDTRRLMPSYSGAQAIPGWLLTVRETSLMAQPFDAEKLALTGEPVRVAEKVHYDDGVWRGTFSASQNGVLVYRTASGAEGGQLTWFDRSGKELGTLGQRERAFYPRISPDGRRAAVAVGDPSGDAWAYDVVRGVKIRISTRSMVGGAVIWSPDGSSVAFLHSVGSSAAALVTVLADGSGAEQPLLPVTERMQVTDWSSHGRYLLVDKGEAGATDVWAVPVAEPGKMFSLVSTPFQEHQGQFSPDGRWVAYTSRESGRDEVYVTPFPAGGAKIQVSATGGSQPRWRRNGEELFFVSADNHLMAAQVHSEAPSFEVTDVRPLFGVNLYVPRLNMFGYDVTPDGQRFLLNSAGEAQRSEVKLVANWQANLERK